MTAFTRPARLVPSTRRAHHVYLVELDARACPQQWRCVYVGETGPTPEERFARHMEVGRTAARVVTRYGIRLRPDLAEEVGPFSSREEAVAAERKLAQALRGRGWTVFGVQGRSLSLAAAPIRQDDSE